MEANIHGAEDAPSKVASSAIEISHGQYNVGNCQRQELLFSARILNTTQDSPRSTDPGQPRVMRAERNFLVRIPPIQCNPDREDRVRGGVGS